MPFRDHFRPPVSDRSSWEEVHGGWPMVIVQQLVRILPEPYVAAPRVHLGSEFEVDVRAYERVGGDRHVRFRQLDTPSLPLAWYASIPRRRSNRGANPISRLALVRSVSVQSWVKLYGLAK